MREGDLGEANEVSLHDNFSRNHPSAVEFSLFSGETFYVPKVSVLSIVPALYLLV